MRGAIAFALALTLTTDIVGSEALADQSKGVRTPRAVQLFDAVCIKTLPNFRDASKRIEAFGSEYEGKNPNKDFSLGVIPSPDGSKICILTYGTVETIPNLMRGLRLLGDIQPTGGLTAEVPIRGTKHVTEIRVDDLRQSGRIVVTLSISVP